MGNKRIINLDDTTQIVIEVGANESGAVIIASNPVSFLPPYTEPDTEQVRKEAYDKGYKDGTEAVVMPDDKIHEAYQKGLDDAWEAARKIKNMSCYSRNEIFGTEFSDRVFKRNTPSEAIEKIRQYEQGQEINVGDEVAFHHTDGRPDTVVVVTYIGDDGYIDGMDGRGTQYAHKNPKKWTKTGRHFPEIAAVLQKMKGV